MAKRNGVDSARSKSELTHLPPTLSALVHASGEEVGARDMQSSARQEELPGAVDIGVSQIHHKQQVVFLNRRIEQERPSIA